MCRDVAVLGAGPVGLLAAVRSAQLGRSVLLVAPSLPRRTDPPRVEAISVSTLALLSEFGLAPARFGVGKVHRERWASWEQSSPTKHPVVPSVHVERSLLDAALAEVLGTFPNIVVQQGRARRGTPPTPAVLGVRWILDATGRVAVTSRRRIGPARPWVGRLFWTPRHGARRSEVFAIAATPKGYVYRLGSAYGTTLGFVGRRNAVRGPAENLEKHHISHAGWLLGDLPLLVDMIEVSGGGASVQWCETCPGTVLVGAAALGRDALSSQGLGTGLSEALAAAALTNGEDERLLSCRQEEQRRRHLESLGRTCASHRFADAPAWIEYRAFLESHERTPARLTAALRAGRLVQFRRASAPYADNPAVGPSTIL